MILFVSLVWLSLSACTVKNKGSMVVLIPDPNGKVGEVVVSNQGGTQVIAKANHITTIRDAEKPPTPPAAMDETEIQMIFGAALAAQPEPPVTFILYFEIGSTEPNEKSAKLIPDIIANIQARKSADIMVVGHTDTVSTKHRNYELSRARAEKIKEILTSRGVDPTTIEIDSHGQDDLLVKTPDPSPELRNRRVEITIR